MFVHAGSQGSGVTQLTSINPVTKNKREVYYNPPHVLRIHDCTCRYVLESAHKTVTYLKRSATLLTMLPRMWTEKGIDIKLQLQILLYSTTKGKQQVSCLSQYGNRHGYITMSPWIPKQMPINAGYSCFEVIAFPFNFHSLSDIVEVMNGTQETASLFFYHFQWTITPS